MPDTEVSKELSNLVQTEIGKQLGKSVNDEHKNKEFISIDEINTHQDSCSCPDCPFCRSMNKRIEVVKDDNLISETIGRASKLINSKLSENKDIDYSLLRDIELTTSNDESFYKSTHIPFVKNYRRKQQKNIYNKDLALKGIVNNYVPRAIKFYEKQNNNKISISKQEKNTLGNEYLKNVLQDIKDGLE